MEHFFPFCGRSVLWQKWWDGVFFGVDSSSQWRVSLVVDIDCVLIDGGGSEGSREESVQDFHTSADLVVKDAKSFLLAGLFLDVKWTEVQPKPCGGSQECESGLKLKIKVPNLP